MSCWTRGCAALIWAAAFAAPSSLAGQHHQEHGQVRSEQTAVPLYDNLGTHHYSIRTADSAAQAYFDQGLRLYYAFNHPEAIASFRQAQAIDPACAMCWWGEALAWGPNINLPMDSAAAVAAFAALQGALASREHATEAERALIDALALRYVAEPGPERANLDQAYAEAMHGVADRHPDDPEASVLYAESLLDLRPWDYWTADGGPQPGIQDALDRLEAVLARNPNHPGACHFFIHTVEKLYPKRAVPCAERLAALMPGAGHLVHMPGHIYIRVGRYRDAIEANKHAVHADETFIQDRRPGTTNYTAGYYPHNYDFLAFAALMIGDATQAIAAADQVAALIPAEMMGVPGMGFLQHWSVRPLLVRVRFERWDELLAAPMPAAELPHAQAIWHYARGRAYAAQGNVPAARAELERLRAIANSPEIEGLRMEFNRSADLLAIATEVLAGWTEAAAGQPERAVAHLEEAVRREDALLYGEPPEWTVPVRQELGAVLLGAGRWADAERVFGEDLDHFPDNHWSSAGLAWARERR